MPNPTNIQTVNSLEKPVFSLTIKFFQSLTTLFTEGGEQLDHTFLPVCQALYDLAEIHGEEEVLATLQSLHRNLENTSFPYQALCYEYNRLFVGPVPPLAPPYESVYRTADHLVMQSHTLDVRRFYRSEKLSTVRRSEPDDFIATELEFALYLLSQAMKVSSQSPIRSEHYLEVYSRFWEEHLNVWIEPFLKQICRSTSHPWVNTLSQAILTLYLRHGKLN